ncbi:WRKY13 [Artemisia annua]|uniref:WRKY13 n=1 Tax=Artemisia annua TaxID=35608 RepID=A0A2U1N7L2_ARTAN|nr:WRKY13 [Artemisia annua]
MEELAVREAGAAGLQSLEHLIGLLSTHHHRKPSYSTTTTTTTVDYTAVADVAVNKFKKFISLLDRSSTGHARFRRGPISQNQIPIQKKSTLTPVPSPANIPATAPSMIQEKVFAPVSIQQRVVKSGSFERKDVPTATINFAGAAVVASPATSFMSSLTGDTDGLQPSMSSGFQITNMSQVSSAGQPNASNSSFKRKCNSVDDSHTKCTNSSGRCHCTKKRYKKYMCYLLMGHSYTVR